MNVKQLTTKMMLSFLTVITVTAFSKDLSDTTSKPRDNDEQFHCTTKYNLKKGGFGLVINPQMHFYDTKILRNLLSIEPTLQNQIFHFKREPLFMLGLQTYFITNNQVKFGLEASVGSKKMTSKVFSLPLIDINNGKTVVCDFVYTFRVIPLHAGLLCEKIVGQSRVQYNAGIMFGGGCIYVMQEYEQLNNLSASVTSNQTEGNFYAPVVVGDVHGGISYALCNYFHLWTDGALTVSYAPEGFVNSVRHGDFLMVNPRIKCGFVIGK